MANDDFELRLARLGLSHLPADVACDETFASDGHGSTVLSQPRPLTGGHGEARPGVVGGDVVGDPVQPQAKAVPLQGDARRGQALLAAETRIDAPGAYGVG